MLCKFTARTRAGGAAAAGGKRVPLPALATLVVSGIATFALGGCSRGPAPLERAHVAGFVSLDGKPLPTGEIRFIPTAKTKGPAAVAVITDGAYELVGADGPIIGTHRIEIEAGLDEGAADDEEFAKRIALGEDPIKKIPIHSSYNRDSILTAEVTKEGNLELDFPLNSEGTAPPK